MAKTNPSQKPPKKAAGKTSSNTKASPTTTSKNPKNPSTPTKSPTWTNPQGTIFGPRQKVTIFGQDFLYDPDTGNYYSPEAPGFAVAHLDKSGVIQWANQGVANWYSQYGQTGNAKALPSWATDPSIPSAIKDQMWDQFYNKGGGGFAPGEGQGGGGAPGDGTGDGSGGGGGDGGLGGGLDGGGGGTGGGGTGTGTGGLTQAQQNLLDDLQGFLAQYGLDNLTPFIQQAISNGWTKQKTILELRKNPVYLAAFPENAKRNNNGLSFMPEEQILAYRDEVKRIAKQFGYGNVSNNYIAEALGQNVSVAEIEHRFQLTQKVQEWGPFVKAALEQELGISDVSDTDLWEFFDPAHDTTDWDQAVRRARLRNQPIAFGLDQRSDEELRALQMLGISDDEAINRYQQMGQNVSRFARLGAIQDSITEGLPKDFGSFMAKVPNELQRDAILFQKPDAMAELQNLWIQETARFKGTGAVAGNGQGLLALNAR